MKNYLETREIKQVLFKPQEEDFQAIITSEVFVVPDLLGLTCTSIFPPMAILFAN